MTGPRFGGRSRGAARRIEVARRRRVSLREGTSAAIFVDGDQAGQGRVEHTVGILFASHETTTIGCDTSTVVTDAYGPSGQNDFTGNISWIRLDVGDDAHDPNHYIPEADRLATILGRQ